MIVGTGEERWSHAQTSAGTKRERMRGKDKEKKEAKQCASSFHSFNYVLCNSIQQY